MRRFTIAGGRLLTPMRELNGWMLVVRDGVITYAGRYDPDQVVRPILDACGQYIAPGFIDIHIHGGGGHDFMDGTAEAFTGASRAHAAHGTTTLLPTSLVCSDEELLGMFDVFRRVRETGCSGASMPGLHLEGPFFAASQRGAQDSRYIGPPAPARYERILEKGEGLILRWSAAPELPGGMEFGRVLRSRGILASIGHSDATAEVACAAIENGYSHLTHLYSGMSGLGSFKSCCCPGLIESAFLFDELTAEIIADGCHLPASLLRHCYRSLGANRLALVTDSMRGAGMPDGESILGSLRDGQPCIIEDGAAKLPGRSAVAGSAATADRLVRNMNILAGAPMTDAVKMMTMTPARIMGMKDRGMLVPGFRADIVLFDGKVHVSRTIVGGETVFAE